jgi:hypothetical protein
MKSAKGLFVVRPPGYVAPVPLKPVVVPKPVVVKPKTAPGPPVVVTPKPDPKPAVVKPTPKPDIPIKKDDNKKDKVEVTIPTTETKKCERVNWDGDCVSLEQPW